MNANTRRLLGVSVMLLCGMAFAASFGWLPAVFYLAGIFTAFAAAAITI
jgi:type IV secretory pathway VirB2 component (pilin)